MLRCRRDTSAHMTPSAQPRSRFLTRLVRKAEYAASAGQGILANRFVSAKLVPLAAGQQDAIIFKKGDSPQADDGLPLPPPELWSRWGMSPDEYLREGAADAAGIVAALAEAGVAAAELPRVLDFGCAEGRVLRYFPRSEGLERWGVDVNADRITWAQQHLSPPLYFATTTTAPHLPFADEYFDFVYGLSVFTHISELADAWFLELLRIVRPGGHIWLTIHDEHTVKFLLDPEREGSLHGEMVDLLHTLDQKTGILSRDWVYFSVLADPAAQVFHNSDHLVARWSPLADCLAVKPEATGYQTALVFQKHAS
jgi:SAM-dependent methyltransferase